MPRGQEFWPFFAWADNILCNIIHIDSQFYEGVVETVSGMSQTLLWAWYTSPSKYFFVRRLLKHSKTVFDIVTNSRVTTEGPTSLLRSLLSVYLTVLLEIFFFSGQLTSFDISLKKYLKN